VPGGEIWLTDGLQYKFVLKDANDITLATYDNVVGINSNFINYTSEQEIQTATAGQTVFTLTTMQYQPGTGSLSVFVDGVNQYGPGAQYAFVETDSTTVTFVSGLHVGASVKFTTAQIQNAGVGDASQVTYGPPFTGSVVTNVESKLAETVSITDFGAVADYNPNTNTGTDSTAAIQAAIDSGASRIYVPNGKYKVTATLNITNRGVTGEPLIIYGDGFSVDQGSGSYIYSKAGFGKWIADFTGSQFITVENIGFISQGAGQATYGFLYARSTLSAYAQNNSLTCVMIKVATAGGSVAVGNDCAEHFSADRCWLEADFPLVTTLGNEAGFVSEYATISTAINSNTLHNYRLTTFKSFGQTAMQLQGLASATFDTCIWTTAPGLTTKAITLLASYYGYLYCMNLNITGQVEYYQNAAYLNGNTQNVSIKLATSNVTAEHVVLEDNTAQYNLNVETVPLDAVVADMLVVGSGGVGYATMFGGVVTVGPNLTLADNKMLYSGTTIQAQNLALNSANFAYYTGSSFNYSFTGANYHASTAWSPGAILDGASASTTVTVTGVNFGDVAFVASPYSLQNCSVSVYVSAADTVTIVLSNNTGTTKTFGSGTWRVSTQRQII